MTNSIQQQEQTMNDLNNFEPSFIPHFVLAIGEDRFDYELSEYNLLTEQVSTIYKNINEYKDNKIEVWWEMGGEGYEPITIIQECKGCNEDICCCEKCNKCEKIEEECDCDFTDSEEEEEEEKINTETVMKLCETEVPVRHLKNINTVD